MPKIQPAELPLYDRCELVGSVCRSEYVPRVEAGELLPVGNQKRWTALHVVYRNNVELKGEVPTGKRFSFLEHLGTARVWQHSKRATQPCPDRDALLTGQVR